jgi:hypothetical protein
VTTEVKEILKGTVMFTRKIQPVQYESAEMSAVVQTEIDPDNSQEDIAAKLRDCTATAQAIVFDTLGLPYAVDDKGVLHVDDRAIIDAAFNEGNEKLAEPKPTTAKAKGKGKAPKAGQPTKSTPGASDVPDLPPYPADTEDPDEVKANRAWAKDRLEVAPDEFWDNRDSRKGKQPHYRHKDTKIGVWL